MFVSQERGATRKPFQKPNILRRKSRVARLNPQKNDESPEITAMSTANRSILLLTPSGHVETIGRCSPSVQSPQFAVVGYHENNLLETSQTLEINGDSMTIYAHNVQEENNEACAVQNTLNVESFLNDGANKQTDNLNKDTTIKIETDSKQNWCLDFMSEDSKDALTTNYYDGSQTSTIYVDKSSGANDASVSSAVSTEHTAVASLITYEINTSPGILSVPAQNVTLQSVSHTSGPVKLKCDEQDCNKSFWTEARLQKHKNTHRSQKDKTPSILTCPVKKAGADGIVNKCDRTFLIRSELMNHLNEDHSPDDALYRCGACGRRFFWAGGARAHQAGACERALVCAWAGCGRVFRQPCRLREHARAHTGDRPYPCHYPNCGWAFRSASKLVRHARRHTGERRHACAACGRAFPRREHLREHAARHHPPGERPVHACSEPGCEQTFKSTSSLDLHLKKVHMKNEGKTSATKRTQKNTRAKKEMFVVSLIDTPTPKLDASVETTSKIEVLEHVTEETAESPCTEEDLEMDSDVTGEEGRSARTHCTWPLERLHSEYSIEEDEQVEQSESSESNIYTVRSDLFLHGNVLINEDSEFIRIGGNVAGGAEGGEGDTEGEGVGDGAGAEGSSLSLIDVHPTIDLMQEELMYADAVDESSFRVFLLNGEELT